MADVDEPGHLDGGSLPQGRREDLDSRFRSDPMASSLGLDLQAWGLGTARVELAIGPQHSNFVGGAHGGVLFSIGDFAMSVASNSHGRLAVAVQLDISYHHGVQIGDVVVATAKERSRSRQLGSYLVELHVQDRLVASSTGMTFRTQDWWSGADVWPEEWRRRY
jgi:acyl-CoA thioesterase